MKSTLKFFFFSSQSFSFNRLISEVYFIRLTKRCKTRRFLEFDPYSGESEHAEILRIVPNLVYSWICLRIFNPLLISQRWWVPIKNVEVVKLQQSLDFIFNIILSILYIHGVYFVNFLHKLNKLIGDQFDHLFNRNADILITRTDVGLGDWATFLEDLIEDFGLVLDISSTIQNGE